MADETIEEMAARTGLPVELLRAPVTWTPPAVPDPRFRDQLAEEMWSKHDRPATGIPWEDVSDGTRRMWLRWADIVAAEVEARVQAAANQRAAEVEQVMEAQYRAAWAAWEKTVGQDDEITPESRIAWGRVNQALDDQKAVAAALAQPAPATDGD